MKAALWGACLLAGVNEAWAHRLDEFLQATRIAVSSNRIELAFALTPGVAVADQVLIHLDPNRDGHVSDAESRAYGQRFLKDLGVGLDGKVLSPALTDIGIPAMKEIRDGVGMIRIRATASVAPMAAGNHALSLTNGHLPGISVYLVNALRPDDPVIELGRQLRDEYQQGYWLEFRVQSGAR